MELKRGASDRRNHENVTGSRERKVKGIKVHGSRRPDYVVLGGLRCKELLHVGSKRSHYRGA